MSRWQQLDTFPDGVTSLRKVAYNGVLLYNECDGIHFVHPAEYLSPSWYELLFLNTMSRDHMFSRWMPAPLDPDVASGDSTVHQPDRPGLKQ